jgi:DNA-binding HxlR family transcriptional regulator
MPITKPSGIPTNDFELCEQLTGEEEATLREVISRVADKWSLWSLSELAQSGPLRFSRLLERVEGVSQKSLTATLRHLERDGLITRTVAMHRPIRVDYEVTELGHAMVEQVHPMWIWAIRNRALFTSARTLYDQAHGS